MNDPSSWIGPNCPWSQYELGNLLSCEERLCSWIRQPLNTWSSFTMVLVGIGLILAGTRQSKKTSSTTQRNLGFFATLIGLASVMSHASQIRFFVFWDFFSQLLFFAYAWILNLRRLKWLSTGRGEVAYFSSALAVSVGPMIIDKKLGPLCFSILFAALVVTEIFKFRQNPRPQARDFVIALSLFAAGLICFTLDTTRVVCYPSNHLFQLHAAWHVLTATALFFYALYLVKN